MTPISQSPLDGIRTQVEALFKRGLTDEEIVRQIDVKTTARSISRARRRWGYNSSEQAENAGVKINGDEAEVTTDPRQWTTPLNDTDALLRERGLDPEDWVVHSVIVNEWDSVAGDGITLKQFKLHLRRKKPMQLVIPARVKLELPPYESLQTIPDGPRLIVLVGDQQAPYHNVRLHRLFLDWLDENKPEEGILMGDTGDFPNISRHPAEPAWAATTQGCVDAVGQVILDYTLASRETEWLKLPGNHDERLRRSVINQLSEFYDLRPAQIESMPDLPPIHDPVHLYRLDELGIEYIRPKGSYKHASVKLSENLVANHGWLAKKGSGSSAHATLDHLGHSVVIGHTHRQAHVFQTKFDVDGNAQTITAVETGCMCQIEEGLGHSVAPDWQNGFATATVWPDGKFHLELATYVNETLLYQDQRYS